MRLLIATFLALALTLLPVSGVTMADAMAGGAHAGAMTSCHDSGADQPASRHDRRDDMGRACAEHCMTQVSTPFLPNAAGAPSIANAVTAEHAALIDARAPRAADPPETPPPRG